MEDRDVVMEGEDGLIAVGQVEGLVRLDADTTSDSAKSGDGSEELVDVVESLLEEVTGGSS